MLLHKKSRTLALISILSIASISLFYFYYTKHSRTKIPTYYISIVTAHNEKVKEVAVPYLQKKFKEKFNANLHIEWAKHGSQNTNAKIIEIKFEKNKGLTSGYHLIWGGDKAIFDKLEKAKRLAPLHLTEEIKQNIPSHLAGTKLYTQTWIATCLSSFGMIYNKTLFNKLGLPTPTTWKDLTSTKLLGKIVSVNPRLSDNMLKIYMIKLQAYGWEKGWEILIKTAANSIVFLDHSSSAANSIVQGIGLIALTNDFYAQTTIHTHGKEKLGFIIPTHHNTLNPDPIARLKGPKGFKATIANFCIECILSPEFQRLLMLKKQTLHGPTSHTLGRIAINKKAYEGVKQTDIASIINPFKINKNQFMHLDTQKSNKQSPIVSALFQAYCITPHKQLKEAWRLIIQHGCKPEEIQLLATPPLTQKQVEELCTKWSDPVFKQKCIIHWTNQAIKRYQSITDKYKR